MVGICNKKPSIARINVYFPASMIATSISYSAIMWWGKYWRIGLYPEIGEEIFGNCKSKDTGVLSW